MKLLLDMLLWVLTALSAGLCVYWAIVAFHVLRTIRTVPTLRDGLGLPNAGRTAAPVPVCVIVPAHNEEACVTELVRSLQAQDHPALRVVFALDRCTDRTEQVIRALVNDDFRFEFVHITQCPQGWTGKVHAMWRGVQDSAAAAAAPLILFVDADCTLDPGCVRAAVTLLEHRKLDMLSVLSTLTAERWFEKLVQPAAGMELMRQYPVVRANSPSPRRRAFANGQFILVRRDAYDAAGGHEAIRSEVLEDVWLARKVAHLGRAAGLLLSDGMLRCRMYTTWPAFERGWLRIFGEGANRKPGRLRKSARRIVLTGAALPLAGLTALIAGIVLAREQDGLALAAAITGALGLKIWGATIAMCYRIGRAPLWAVPGYAIGVCIVAAILRKAARNLEAGKPTLWAGMVYQQQTR